MAKHVLVIEDDRALVEVLQMHLSDQGFKVSSAQDGCSGLEKAESAGVDLVILDVMLPELDGIEVLKGIRASAPALPVLMLTSRSEEIDKVLGLELGADDYVTKPFSVRELIARVKGLLRRVDAVKTDLDGERAPARVELGELVVDGAKRKVTLAGVPIKLTAKEFDLLYLLASNPGRAYSRAQLLDLVWGYSFEGYEHTVNSHINRLRSKIERDPSNPTYVRTVWGVGYRFAEGEELSG